MADPYETLGVPKDATPDQIRKAFRAIARHAHPDRAGGDHDRMAAANDAYSLRSDPERRKRFDETGDASQPLTIEHKAQELLFQAMAHVLSTAQPEQDVVKIITRSLSNSINEGKLRQVEVRTHLRHLERQRSLIEDEGFFAGLFDGRKEQLERTLRSIDEQIEVIEVALERLKTIRWTGEEPTPTRDLWDSTSATTGGWR